MPGYTMEHDKGIKGIILSGIIRITNQEYVDATNFYLHKSYENLENVKVALELFTTTSSAKINWHESNPIYIFYEQRHFQW